MSDKAEVVDAEIVHVTAQEPAEASMWRHFRKVGLSLAQSNFVPQPFQNRPDEIMAALAYGHELGLGPMQSLQSFDVIQGKPTLKPETMRALIRGAGHTLMRVEATSESVTFYGKRRDTGDEETVTYTIADAHALGLTAKKNWKEQPRAMLTARATAEIARSLFSDVIMGASYTPEELEFVPQAPQAAELGGGGDVEIAVGVDTSQSSAVRAAADPAPPPPNPLSIRAQDEALRAFNAAAELRAKAGRLIDGLPAEYHEPWRAYVRSVGISFNWQNWSAEQALGVIDWVISEEESPEVQGAAEARAYTEALL